MIYTEGYNGEVVASYDSIRPALLSTTASKTYVRNNTNAEIIEAINERRDFVTNDYYFIHQSDMEWALAVDAEGTDESYLFEILGTLTLNEDVTIASILEAAKQTERIYARHSKNK